MKVALIGATGKAGSKILNELVNRGHTVTAIARNVESIAATDQVTPQSVDGSGGQIQVAISGHDAVVSSVRFVDLDPDILIPAVVASGVPRYVVVGGAGSLLHPDDTREIDQPGTPEAIKPNSQRGGEMLDALKQIDAPDWVFISPPRMFIPGERTGVFRYGKDHMLMKDGAPTSISFDDFAIVVVDEIEEPKHHKERFTIGY